VKRKHRRRTKRPRRPARGLLIEGVLDAAGVFLVEQSSAPERRQYAKGSANDRRAEPMTGGG